MTTRRILVAWVLMVSAAAAAQNVVTIRGKEQELQLYGTRGSPPILLSSGDLGWAGLVVHVAEHLSSAGYFVIGFNSRSYLSGFTSKSGTLTAQDVPKDYGVLVEFALKDSRVKPILAGVSEGAGLSVLAATRAEVKGNVLGVLALGLPNQNELGWKWQDATIWITKRAPDEPGFMVADIIANVSPLPLAEIHSTHDEFLPLDKAKAMFALAGEPKKMWTIEASNHRFGDNREELDRRILEALAWIKQRPSPSN